MPFIYRIATADDVGMYSAASNCDKLMEVVAHLFGENHHSPSDDDLISPYWNNMDLEERSEWKFGFSSIIQLKTWLHNPEWIKKLQAGGVYLHVLSIADESYIDGESQCIYKQSAVQNSSIIKNWEEYLESQCDLIFHF